MTNRLGIDRSSAVNLASQLIVARETPGLIWQGGLDLPSGTRYVATATAWWICLAILLSLLCGIGGGALGAGRRRLRDTRDISMRHEL
jgi:hypothetical protein